MVPKAIPSPLGLGDHPRAATIRFNEFIAVQTRAHKRNLFTFLLQTYKPATMQIVSLKPRLRFG